MKGFYILRYSEKQFGELRETAMSFSETNHYGIYTYFNYCYPDEIMR